MADPPPVYNILLLGPTGVGKTTTINTVAAFQKYKTFENALKNFEELISLNFMLPNPDTGEFTKIISPNPNHNERVLPGSSSTYQPIGYKFAVDGRVYRMIDTPGIGDTNNMQQDRNNLDKIFSQLKDYKNLHAIIVVIPSNMTNINIYFSYCIAELLMQLPKSARKNLFFFFTFSRISYFEPGESFYLLKNFFPAELPDVDIELKPNENCFFIDNDAHRYLVAKQQNPSTGERHKQAAQECWDNFAREFNKFTEKMVSCETHDLEEMILLDITRKMILELAGPIVVLQRDLQSKILLLNEQKKQEAKRETILDEFGDITKQVDEIHISPLEYPRTVCTDEKCVEVVQVNGENQILYKTVCHNMCMADDRSNEFYLRSLRIDNIFRNFLSKKYDLETPVIGHKALKHCSVMKSDGTCAKCGCSWEKHMYTQNDYSKIQTVSHDEDAEQEREVAFEKYKGSRLIVLNIESVLEEYRHELGVIQQICAKFAYYLEKYSNMPFNAFIFKYLDYFMDEEKRKSKSDPENSTEMYDSLMHLKELHTENVRLFGKTMQNEAEFSVKPDDIKQYTTELSQLTHTGKKFAKILNDPNWVKDFSPYNLPEQQVDCTTPQANSSASFFSQFIVSYDDVKKLFNP